MYEDTLIRLSRDERFRCSEAPEHTVSEVRNPACGDEIALTADLSGGRIAGLRFYAQGCAVSVASATALCEELNGLALPEAVGRIREALDFFAGREDWTATWGGNTLPALGAVRSRPMRMACVRMAWEGMKKALENIPPAGKTL
jgi:nitrogen fixation NifU-like protein